MTTPGDPEPLTPKRTPPRPVVIAFWALVASVAYTVLQSVVLIINYSSEITQIVADRKAGTSIADATSLGHAVLNTSLVIAFVQSAVYVGGAFLFKAGKNWARITVTIVVVLFGLLTLLGGTVDVRVLALVLIEVFAVALLYVPSAKEFFVAARRRSV